MAVKLYMREYLGTTQDADYIDKDGNGVWFYHSHRLMNISIPKEQRFFKISIGNGTKSR